jgi:hypothetical protein
VTGGAIAEAADRLEAQARSSAVLADDPLAPVLRASVDLGRAMAEAIDRLEKLGSKPLDEKVIAAVERASKTIAFRLAGNIDRRTSIILATALMLAGAIGGAIGYAIGTADAGRGPLAICWQTGGARVCAPAVWLKPRG